jgi:hypothetical protein
MANNVTANPATQPNKRNTGTAFTVSIVSNQSESAGQLFGKLF